MISLRRLIMKPGSPDRAIEQAWSESEAGLARIAHVNRLSRDIMDIKYYEADFNNTDTTTIRIDSKKGIVKVIDPDHTTGSLYIYLQNKEIDTTLENFYMQLSVLCDSSSVKPIAIAIGNGMDPTTLGVEIHNTLPAANWSRSHLYFELVKID